MREAQKEKKNKIDDNIWRDVKIIEKEWKTLNVL